MELLGRGILWNKPLPREALGGQPWVARPGWERNKAWVARPWWPTNKAWVARPGWPKNKPWVGRPGWPGLGGRQKSPGLAGLGGRAWVADSEALGGRACVPRPVCQRGCQSFWIKILDLTSLMSDFVILIQKFHSSYLRGKGCSATRGILRRVQSQRLV